MRVLYLLGFMPPYVEREISALAATGASVSVLLPEKTGENRPADFWNSISGEAGSSSSVIYRTLKFTYLTCPVWKLVLPLLKSLRYTRSLLASLREREFRYFLIAAAAVSSMGSQWMPDVIHAHFALDNAHIARIMAVILKIPYTVTTHATDIFVPASRQRLERVLAGAATVFTISNYNADYLIGYGVSLEKIVVAPLGLDTTTLPKREQPPETAVALCTASGLVPKKGVQVLLDSMRLLKRRGVNCSLTVIGSDPEGIELKRLRENNADIPVTFMGLLNSQQTLEALTTASFFVLPCVEASNGDKDGVPVSLMEAMGMGVPCISTAISGIPELIENDVSGILVKPGSPEELSEAMESLVLNTDRAEKLGEAGKIRVKDTHDPANHAHAMSSNFNRIVEGRKQN